VVKENTDSYEGNPIDPAKAVDRMLGLLLRDYLRKSKAPDFEQRILAKLEARRIGEANTPFLSDDFVRFSDEELDEALGAAQADVEFERHEPAVRLVPRPKSYSKSRRLDPRLWDYRLTRQLSWMLSLAAACAAVFVGWNWWREKQPMHDPIATSYPELPDLNKGGTDEVEIRSEVVQDKPVLSPTESRIASPSEKIQNEPSEPSKLSLASASEVYEPIAPLTTKDLTQVINAQLSHLWQENQLAVKFDPSPGDEWLNRVSFAAVGRAPTAAERQSFRNANPESRADEWVHRLVHSEEFTNHWSRLLAEYYLGGPLPPPRSQSADSLAFVQWIAESLNRGNSIASMEAELLSDEYADSPANYWLTESLRNGLLANKDYSTFSKVKLGYNNVDAPMMSAASELMHRTGNVAMSCTQCHRSDDAPIVAVRPAFGDLASNFWGVAASLESIDFNRKVLTDSPPKRRGVFYEEDDKMALAQPALTVEKSNKRFMMQASTWLENSPQARFGIVELVWTKINQQPLVPVFGLDASEGAEGRSDLKQLLAEQLQANGKLQHLITSVLLSDTLRLQEAKPSMDWYLRSKESTLAQYRKATRLFAFVPSSLQRSQPSAWKSSMDLASWLQINQSDAHAATLAQADTTKKIKSTKKNSPVEYSNDQLLYLVSVTQPYARLDEFATKLSTSDLGWQDQLNHAFLLMHGRYPTRAERLDANRIYDLTGQDSKKSLILLVTGRYGSF
jgi:hypothetical protein